MKKTSKTLSQMVRKITGFQSWEDMLNSVKAGYVPTLPKGKTEGRLIGFELSRAGFEVFYI